MPGSYLDELKYWDDKATGIRRAQTETLRQSATKWAALLTALLGAFGAVAFAGGLSAIEDLDEGWVNPVKLLTTVAAGLSVTSIVLLGFVSGGLRVRLQQSSLTGLQLAEEETEPSRSLLTTLAAGRAAAIAAAACVLFGSGIALWAPTAASPVQSIVVRYPDESACGKPIKDSDGVLRVSGRDLSEAVEIVPVSKCP